MDDAIAERGGDDFADNRVVNDEGDAAAGFVTAAKNAVAELGDIFHFVNFKTVFVESFAFAFAGEVVSAPELLQEEI